jgi:hypothetical protein
LTTPVTMLHSGECLMSLMCHTILTAVIGTSAVALVTVGTIWRLDQVAWPGLLLGMAGQVCYYDVRCRWHSAVQAADIQDTPLRAVR